MNNLRNICKFIPVLGMFFIISFTISAQDSLLFNESFESGTLPDGWDQEYVSGFHNWDYQDGGFAQDPDVEGSGKPPYAYDGDYNAFFQKQSEDLETTKLITPPIDLEYIVKPELIFWHAQDERYALGTYNNDELRVYYKESQYSSWKLMEEYTSVVSEWTKRNILLPDSALSSTFYIAFEGKTKNGAGVCIDSVILIEGEVTPKYISNIEYKQASTDFVATETDDNEILRIDFEVEGNDGDLILDSMVVTSLNTDDSDLKQDGVKLYASNDTINDKLSQLGSAKNFTNGKAIFENLNYKIPRGISSVWVTYDIAKDTAHITQDHILDAKITANSIKINTNTFPLVEKSPEGNRTIFESIIFDDFETDMGWTLTGEFERDKPQGLGGTQGGSPDPSKAFSGEYVLGTDLTGLGNKSGNYENNLTNREYKAVSSKINCFYYQNISLYFHKWFNIEGLDTAYIDVSKDNGNTWTKIWQNGGSSIMEDWKREKLSIQNYINRDDSVKVRFSLGGTDGSYAYSGWNIDNFILTGDYISQDVGVVDWIYPIDGCGHTSDDSVTVIVENFGGDPTVDTIPISYSFDGGSTIVKDSLIGSIPVGAQKIFTFSRTVNLNDPGWYKNVWAKTNLAQDEANYNNQFNDSIFVSPTYNPPYSEDFENNYGYWLENTDNSIWDYGSPNADNIDTASSGSYVWGTNTSGLYRISDSSFLESPCFNFSNVRNPVFEFKFWSEIEQGKDGLALYYSLDNGVSWNLVPKNGDYDWNWYTSDTIVAFNSGPGWDTTTNGYIKAKQILPEVTGGQSNVKFSFVFATDDINRYEGVAIDDIKIYEAPPDVAVTAIDSPRTQCYQSDTVHTRVYVKNTGIDTLFAGQEIPMRLKFQDEPVIKDTLTLEDFLIPQDSVLFEFSQTVDMSDSGDYAFKVYSVLEDDPYFYDSINNDTITDTVTVLGMPNYDVGFIIGVPSSETIDTTLDAGPGFASYQWASGLGNLATTRTYDVVDTTGWFYITVTNDSACVASDSVKVVDSDINVGVTQILTDFQDSCERNDPVYPQVEISNMGIRDFNIGDTLPVAFQINDMEPVIDTIFLERALNASAPDSTLDYTYPDSIDLSEPGEYNLKFYTDIKEDYNPFNDTMYVTVNTWGYPDTELRHDTVITAQADSITLDAGSGFDTYTWQDGSSTQTYDISHNRSQWYKVTVTDVNGCGDDKDSTLIIANDVGIEELVAPADACEFTSSETVDVKIKNHSADTLQDGESIDITLVVDDTIQYNDVLTLSSVLDPDSVRTFTLPSTTVDISAVGVHSFKVYHKETFDVNRQNDTIETTVETYGYPDVEIARDTIYTTKADTVQLYAGEGFGTYNWSTGSTNDTLFVSDKYSKQYTVTVTDVHGCGEDKDSVQIFTYNLGINEMLSPESDCELTSAENIEVSVKNYGADTLKVGESLEISMIYNTDTLRDNVTFSDPVYPNKSFTHTFSETVDMSEFKTYYFKFFTNHPYEANRSNDSIVDAVKTYGYPEFSLNFDTLYTTMADSVKIYPDIQENSYLWQNEYSGDTLEVTNKATATYMLTVSDINGCSWSDTADIITYDFGIDSVVSPSNACELSSSENLAVQFRNYGYDTLQSGMDIPVYYQYEGGSVNMETITLTDTIYPDSVAIHNFSGSFDLGSPGAYNFKAWTDFEHEVKPENDTVSQDIEHWGFPQIDLGEDTIFTNDPTSITLDPGSGYASYEWMDGQSESTYDITDEFSKEYSVIVRNTNECPSYDTIQIITYDIGVSEIVSPDSACANTGTEQVTVAVKNYSADTLQPGDEFTVAFSMGSYSEMDNATLQDMLLPYDTLHYHFDTQVDMIAEGNYTFTSFAKYDLDVDVSNDTVDQTLTTHGYPDIDLGADTVFTAESDSILLEPGAGYAEYLWQDGSEESTFQIMDTASKLYHVEVTSEFGCKSYDSLQIIASDMESYAITSLDSACELSTSEEVTVRVVNSSPDTHAAGDEIPLSLVFNENSAYQENLTLSDAMEPGDTVNFTFSETFDLSQPGTYTFEVITGYPNDVDITNDTSEYVVEIFGYPEPDLGEDKVVEALSYTLDPGEFDLYEWHNLNRNRTFTITEDNQTADDLYYVKVTDTNGCSASDTVEIQLNIRDIRVANLLSPTNQCLSADPVPVKMKVTNTGTITISGNTQIPVFYRIDGVVSSDETLTLSNDLLPGNSVNYTFDQQAEFDSDDTYNITANIALANDLRTENDEVSGSFEIYPLPNVDLGPDTLTTELPHTLDAGNFAAFEWQDGSRGKTFVVNEEGTYWVKVTSQFGCTASDTIYVEEEQPEGIISLEDSDIINIFPNPAEDKFYVQLKTREKTIEMMRLIEATGGQVYMQKNINGKGTVTIDTEKYARGIYYLILQVGDKYYQKKIVLQ